jgi:hypothetical protein
MTGCVNSTALAACTAFCNTHYELGHGWRWHVAGCELVRCAPLFIVLEGGGLLVREQRSDRLYGVIHVRSSGKTVTEVARQIGVSAEGLRNWVKQDMIDRGQGRRES